MATLVNFNYIHNNGDFDFDEFYTYWNDKMQDGLQAFLVVK